MFDNAIEVLKILEKHKFKAYIVGGYVRDIYLSINSNDIDIITNAKPKDILKIFKNNIIRDENYGSFKISYNNSYFDITTFRKDIKYKDKRKPSKIEYVDDLDEDLKRRDFTINTLCMDSNGNIIDKLNAKNDIFNKTIKTVSKANKTISEDSLRILRAIRFATTLNFKIDKDLEKAIIKYSKNLKKLSFHRIKSELNLIFRSDNYQYGLKLIDKYKLSTYLGISNYKNLVKTSDVLGMWAQIKFSNNFPFSKLERNTIDKIREILLYGKIDSYVLYKYENYITFTAGEILNIDKKDLIQKYNNLKIYSRKDIKINIIDISKLLNIEPNKYIRDIFNDIEYKIINDELDNDKDKIKEYIIRKYGDKVE